MLLDVAQVAERLGVTPKRVYYYVARGFLPTVRIGRQIKFSSDQIERWIEAGGTPLAPPVVDDHQGGIHVV